MRIEIDNIVVQNWKCSYPVWFEITQGNDRIKFTHDKALALRNAIDSCMKDAYRILKETGHEKEVIL